MEKTFETEVLTRLTAIETKLDDYKGIKEKVEIAYNRSDKNEKEIEKINERLEVLEQKPAKNWDNLIKTIITGIATAILGFIIAKFGL